MANFQSVKTNTELIILEHKEHKIRLPDNFQKLSKLLQTGKPSIDTSNSSASSMVNPGL